MFTEYLNLKSVYIKNEEKPFESLGNKVLRLTNKNEPPFRANLHQNGDNGIFIYGLS